MPTHDRRNRLIALTPRVAEVDIRSAKPPAKQAEAHYLTPEHRAWRAEVIRRAGGKCEWVDDDGTVCGITQPRMFADHKDERKDGGADLDPANGQCLCGRHHSLKTIAARAARFAKTFQ